MVHPRGRGEHQDMSGLAAIGDEDRTVRRGFFGAAGVLIELATGQGRDRRQTSEEVKIVDMLLRYCLLFKRTGGASQGNRHRRSVSAVVAKFGFD